MDFLFFFWQPIHFHFNLSKKLAFFGRDMSKNKSKRHVEDRVKSHHRPHPIAVLLAPRSHP